MKNFFDKYGKDLKCSECPHLTLCLDKKEPQCASGYMQFQDDKIADLEEKLAESEKEIKIVREQNGRVIEKLDLIVRSNQELEQQLVEKEKSFEWLHNKYAKHIETHNQDKISFCIEKLEKVKETTECVLDNALKNSSLNQSYYDKLLDEIDQLIEEIKGE